MLVLVCAIDSVVFWVLLVGCDGFLYQLFFFSVALLWLFWVFFEFIRLLSFCCGFWIESGIWAFTVVA